MLQTARVVGEVGGVLGLYHGSEGYYKVTTQSHDILFIADKGVLSSTYKVNWVAVILYCKSMWRVNELNVNFVWWTTSSH